MLAARLTRSEVSQGDAVFEQGAPGDCFYIIESGRVGVRINGVERAILGAGEYFGEMALLSDAPRAASVRALQPTTLLRLSGEDFNELARHDSGVKQALERARSRRVLSNERWLRENALAG